MRVNIVNEDGVYLGWFSPESSTAFQNGTSQQVLYKTSSAKWVLSTDNVFHAYLSDEDARTWLLEHSGVHPQEIEEVTSHVKPVGRPVTGLPIQIRLKSHVLADVDKMAQSQGMTRAEWLRDAVMSAIDRKVT